MLGKEISAQFSRVQEVNEDQEDRIVGCGLSVEK